jgi:hypothetical protein
MSAPSRPEPQHDAIDPAKAWILGVLVEDDGSLRPPPATAISWGSGEREGRRRETPICTCPDYCDLEHDLI